MYSSLSGAESPAAGSQRRSHRAPGRRTPAKTTWPRREELLVVGDVARLVLDLVRLLRESVGPPVVLQGFRQGASERTGVLNGPSLDHIPRQERGISVRAAAPGLLGVHGPR